LKYVFKIAYILCALCPNKKYRAPSCPEIVLKSEIVLKFYSFGQNVLIWTLIFKFVACGWHLLRLKCTKFDFGWGSAPDPAAGAYSAPQAAP